MVEVQGPRGLLVAGVLLWLLLFHLLVDSWLLCLLTGPLLVLGGFLGLQAALDSNILLHLERFISVEQISSSEENEEQLNLEIHNTVMKIVRDFVTSWYSTVSAEKSFEADVHHAMVSMAMELKRRARRVDGKVLTRRVLDLVGGHLQDFLKAQELLPEPPRRVQWDSERTWRAYSSVCVPHVAMTSAGTEVNHMRALVDLLLHVLVPAPHLETRSGRFVVGELITANVMLPLVGRLSDPDWLNQFVVALFGRDTPQVDGHTPESTPPLPPLQPAPSLCELSPELPQSPPIINELETENHDDDLPSPVQGEPSVPEECDCMDLRSLDEDEPRPFLRSFLGSKSNPFFPEPDSDLDSPLTDAQQSSLDSGQEDERREGGARSNGLDPEDALAAGDASSCKACPRVLVNSQPMDDTDPSRELLLGAEHTALASPGDPSQMTSPLGSFSFEPLSSPEGPVLIQNLRITGTITAKEHRGTGSHPYTLYTIKYETAVGCDSQEPLQSAPEEGDAPVLCDSPSTSPQIAYHMVNRRYSEFLNLQTRLEERPDLRKLTKGVKGPKKMFPDMPFGNMDSDKIEARKGLLETFLKQLCMIPEVANSEEMQEFLALNTDARIAFVKKPFLTSRIDKIVVNAIVDTLKTAFPRSEPQSPTDDTDEADSVKVTTDKKNKSRIKFSGKNLPLMNGSDVRVPPQFSYDQMRTVFNGMTLADLEAFISDQEQLALNPDSPSDEVEQAPLSDHASRETGPYSASSSGETGPSSASSKDTGPSSASSRDTGPSSASSRDTGPSSASSKDTGPSSTSSRDTGTSSASSRDTGPSSTSSRDTGPFSTSSSYMGPSSASPSYMGPSSTSSRDTGPSSASSSYMGPSSASSRDTGPSSACSRDTGPSLARASVEDPGSETALAEASMDVLCVLMQEHWSWLCTENLQRTLRLLFGAVFNRWLAVGVANLLSTQLWVTYLQVIQEAVWPGGTLPSSPQMPRTQLQKDATKQDALRCLVQLLPGPVLDILGSEKCTLSWRKALDSLQDAYINRHLVYCVLDLLLELLVPEICEDDFQKSLMQSLSKSNDKLPS